MSVAQVQVKWVESSFSVGLAGPHTVIVGKLDTPEGPVEAGFRPAELLLLSVGAGFNSTFSWAVMAQNLTLNCLETTVYGTMAPRPNRFSKVELEISVSVSDAAGFELARVEVDRLIKLTQENCFITNTLQPNLPVIVRQAGNHFPRPVLVNPSSQDQQVAYSVM